MTAFAISISRNKALIAADSLAYVPDRREVLPLGFISKVLWLSQQRSALFSRGQYEILVHAAMDLGMRHDIHDVEDIAEALPDLLRSITADYCDEQRIADPLGAGILEAVLIGWSEKQQRMRCWQFLSYRNYVPEDAGRLSGVLSFPRLPPKYMPRFSGPATDKQLVEIVHACGRYFEAEPEINCGMRVGGEVIATEITPHGISQRILHRFANYEETKHASAAVVARIERGELDVSSAVHDGLVPVGEMIDTETGQSLSASIGDDVAALPAAPINRQQRRAMERAAKKARAA